MRTVIILTVSFALFLAFLAVAIFALTSIDSNPQDEYCSTIGYIAETPSPDKETFVKDNTGAFNKYDPSQHSAEKTFYIKQSSSVYDLKDANWVSQGRPCKLEKAAYFLIAATFVFSFSLSFVFLFLLLLMIFSAFQFLKSKN